MRGLSVGAQSSHPLIVLSIKNVQTAQTSESGAEAWSDLGLEL